MLALVQEQFYLPFPHFQLENKGITTSFFQKISFIVLVVNIKKCIAQFNRSTEKCYISTAQQKLSCNRTGNLSKARAQPEVLIPSSFFFFLFFLNKNEFHSLKTHLNTRLEEENELFIHCIVKRLAHNIDIF